MKKNEKKSFVSKSVSELQKLEHEITSEIEVARVKRHTEQNKNTRSIKALRTKLAVVKTIVREKALGGSL